MKALTDIGYKATDTTKQVIVDGLDSVEQLTGGSVVKRARTPPDRRVPDERHGRPGQILKADQAQVADSGRRSS